MKVGRFNYYKTFSKTARFVSNGCGGIKPIYYCKSYGRRDVLVLDLIVAVIYLFARHSKRHKKTAAQKTFMQKVEESQQRELEKLSKKVRRLWLIIKDWRGNESEEHRLKRLRFYGFSADGTYLSTGENYDEKENGENRMVADVSMPSFLYLSGLTIK